MVEWSILCTSVLDQVVAEIVLFLNSMGARSWNNDNKTTLQSSVAEGVIKDAKTKHSAKVKNARTYKLRYTSMAVCWGKGILSKPDPKAMHRIKMALRFMHLLRLLRHASLWLPCQPLVSTECEFSLVGSSCYSSYCQRVALDLCEKHEDGNYLIISNIMELTYRKAPCTEPEKQQVRRAVCPSFFNS